MNDQNYTLWIQRGRFPLVDSTYSKVLKSLHVKGHKKGNLKDIEIFKMLHTLFIGASRRSCKELSYLSQLIPVPEAFLFDRTPKDMNIQFLIIVV